MLLLLLLWLLSFSLFLFSFSSDFCVIRSPPQVSFFSLISSSSSFFLFLFFHEISRLPLPDFLVFLLF
jgi:hypothetical protein